MRKVLVGVAILLVAMTTGCGIFDETNDDRGSGDAPVQQMPDKEIRVYANGNLFPNVAAFCIGRTGVYTNTRTSGDSVDVIADDPNCRENGLLTKPIDDDDLVNLPDPE